MAASGVTHKWGMSFRPHSGAERTRCEGLRARFRRRRGFGLSVLWFGRREAAVGQLRGSLLPRRGRAKLQFRCNGIHQELGPVRIEVGRIEEEGIAAVWSTHQATLMVAQRLGERRSRPPCWRRFSEVRFPFCRCDEIPACHRLRVARRLRTADSQGAEATPRSGQARQAPRTIALFTPVDRCPEASTRHAQAG